MYQYLRNTHLFLGLFSCLFVLMYGVSSVQMAHNHWFSLAPAVNASQVTLAPGITDARAVARQLIDRHGLRGELAQVRPAPDKLGLRIVRPGTVYEVDYTPSTGAAAVRENRAGFLGMLNRIHHVAGLWHDYWLVNVWGALVGVVSAALVLLGLTGVYLWFKIHKERLVGGFLFAVSLAYSLTLIVLLRAT